MMDMGSSLPIFFMFITSISYYLIAVAMIDLKINISMPYTFCAVN